MKIWKLKSELDKYDILMPTVPFTGDEIQSFDGRSHKDWTPLDVKRMYPEENLPLSDAPGFTIPVFSENAVDALKYLMEGQIELLNLNFKEKKYYGINVINVLNVLDYENAEYKLFKSSGRIMKIMKYEFRVCDELYESNIFKIVDEPRSYVFVSNEFKQCVEDNNLSGFKFQLVWDSEKD